MSGAIDRLLGVFGLRRINPDDPGPRHRQVPVLRAGQFVDHDVALTYSAVYASVRIIAETIATLPWRAMRINDNGNRQHLPNSPVERVLSRSPNPEMTPFSFRATLIGHALTWGNGYAEIERDAAGRVANLWPITPDRIEPRRDGLGQLCYKVTSSKGGVIELDPSEVFHLAGLGFDGVQGYSVISLMAKSVGLGLATEDFGSALFSNGAMPNSILKHPGRLTDESLENLRNSIKDRTSSKNAFKTMILEEGMTWETVGIPPEDAQFLETRKFQVGEIARWFRVPPHKLADLERATFSNIEHQSREFVQDTIMPWTIRLEQEADRKLFSAVTRPPGAYTKINVNALMRGDSQARADYYQKMSSLGVFSVNDIRQLEDMDPIGPDGDKRLVQLNLTTLEKVGEEPPQPAAAPEPMAPEEPDIEEQQDDEDQGSEQG